MDPFTTLVDLRKVLIDFSAFVSNSTTIGKKKAQTLIKELTIIDVTSGCHQHWVLKPPRDEPHWSTSYAVDRRNNWLSKHYHGLDFEFGFMDYESLVLSLNHLTAQASLIFAPNKEKAKILEEVLNARRVVFDLETLGCPPPPTIKQFPDSLVPIERIGYDVTDGNNNDYCEEEGEVEVEKEGLMFAPCLYHQLYAPGFVCTRTSALHMAEWCAQNSSLLDMNDPAIRLKTLGGWKLSKPSAKEVADSGLVRVNCTKDSTKCVYCGVVLCQWVSGDVPMIDHETHSPYCKLIRYNWQLKRKEEEVDSYKLKPNKNTTDCACQGKQPTVTEEFRRRYGISPDITLAELHNLCKA
jgi:hypothetical protein